MKLKQAAAFAASAFAMITAAPALAADAFFDDFNSYTPAPATPWNGGGKWSVTPGSSVDLVKSGGFSIDCVGFAGNCVDLVGTVPQGETNGELMSSMAFALEGGKFYQFSFDYSGNQRGDAASAFMASVERVGGGPAVSFSSGLLGSETGFMTFAQAFPVVDSGSYIVRFNQPLGPSNQGNIIDNVRVGGVPEPTTWAMLIAGFGLAGGMMRRRRHAAAVAIA